MNKKILIAIDGTSASGKGTISKNLAKHFKLPYLDTGKLYRLLALKILKSHDNRANSNTYDIKNLTINEEELNNLTVKNPELQNEVIAILASKLAQKKEIRDFLLPVQRNFAYSQKKGAILDGRDITSVVLTDANVKIFVTAKISIRALRRFKEYKKLNKPKMYKTVLLNLIKRDSIDKKRRNAPLICSKDSLYFDTSNLNVQDITLKIIRKINIACNCKPSYYNRTFY